MKKWSAELIDLFSTYAALCLNTEKARNSSNLRSLEDEEASSGSFQNAINIRKLQTTVLSSQENANETSTSYNTPREDRPDSQPKVKILGCSVK